MRAFLFVILSMMPTLAYAEVEALPRALDLQSAARDGQLTLANRGHDTLELEISAQDIDLRPSGGHLLSPTNDLVALPATLTLAPGETRTITIGVVSAPIGRTSYRVLVTEAHSTADPTYLEIPVVVQARGTTPTTLVGARATHGLSMTAPGAAPALRTVVTQP